MRLEAPRTVLVMVGLPARGKTYIARKLARYLSWLGYAARVFNVGNYRRERLGPRQPAAFFDPDNPTGADARRAMALAALDDCVAWLDAGGDVAIYDATNATRDRRRLLCERFAAHGVETVFIESVCHDPRVIETNVRQTKLLSPDYTGLDPERAVADFRARIAHYERAYEPIDDPDLSFVQLIDVGRQVVVNRMQGWLQSRLVYFLMNLHIVPRTIWLTRHGESLFNVEDRIGGDAALSPSGQAFASRLSKFLSDRVGDAEPVVWTSTLRRTIQTAAELPWPSVPWRALDEIDAGICDGLTYAEVRSRFPEDFVARTEDKLRYRYPRGESYQDLLRRLDPVIIELERQRRPVIVVAHQAVLRALYAYLTDRAPGECPHLDVPLHTVIELTPRAYGNEEHRFTP